MPAPRKYTDAEIEHARALRAQGWRWSDIAKATRIPEGTLIGVLRRYAEAEVERDQSETGLRSAILALIDEHVVIADSRDIPVLLRGRGHQTQVHNVQHVIAALVRSGDLRVVKHVEGRSSWYGRIERRSRPVESPPIHDPLGAVPIPARLAPSGATTAEDAGGAPGPVETPADVEPVALEPSDDTDDPDDPASVAFGSVGNADAPDVTANLSQDWPILTALRDRQRHIREENRRANALLDAAAALESIDPDASRVLEERANAIAGTVALSAVEAEYLAFAAGQE